MNLHEGWLPASALTGATARAMQDALADLDPQRRPHEWLNDLVRRGVGRIPLPGSGATLQRWQALACVARHDLSLAKLFEGHTDALSILHELGADHLAAEGMTWGMWAAEVADQRVRLRIAEDGSATLTGMKCWCSGAATLSHALLTAWPDEDHGSGPQLVAVDLQQDSIRMRAERWRAIGMADSANADVVFDHTRCIPVGQPGIYLSRAGFWQGAAGIAACWYGGTLTLADALRSAPFDPAEVSLQQGLQAIALGQVDLALQGTAALLREAARWIDHNPGQDASAAALRVRLAAEQCAQRVLDRAGRALGATPFCRDQGFARTAADLPVFVRQSHAERDLAALGERIAASPPGAWTL